MASRSWPVNDLPVPSFIYRIYGISALAAAVVLSPLSLSFVPVLLLLGYVYQWRFRPSPFLNFFSQFFLFFALELLFSFRLGPYWALLIALPQLAAVNHELLAVGQVTRPPASDKKRSPSNLATLIFTIVLTVLITSWLTGSMALLVATVAVLLYLGTLLVLSLREIDAGSIKAEDLQLRIVAGSEEHREVMFYYKSRLPGTFFLQPLAAWYRANPSEFIPLRAERFLLPVTVKPDLSGMHLAKFRGTIVDPWGLLCTNFVIEPVRLLVIPRAKYAEWLAQKYLTGSRTGVLPLVSRISNVLTRNGLRRGVEFYGLRMYQPGDSLKNIDWKHSVKYNELVSREFSEVQVLPAIMLVNLVVGNEEEMDKLAFNIIVTAICLAQDNIPAALAAYDDNGPVLTTEALSSGDLVTGALRLTRSIVIRRKQARYLQPPDVTRLKSSIGRLALSESQPARVLHDLLQLEYRYLSRNVRNHPCTLTLNEALYKNNRQSTVLIISQRNHDTDSLALHSYILSNKGNTVVNV